jgi:sulfate transport system permease protein
VADDPPRPARPYRRPRRASGPVTYLLRIVVVAYLLLVAWPVSLVVSNTFEDGRPCRGLLEDPDVVHAFRLTVIGRDHRWSSTPCSAWDLAAAGALRVPRQAAPEPPCVDLPLSVSPIVVGLALVLVYGGRNGWFGPALEAPASR